MEKPVLLITMGDVAGVGPEVIAGVWNRPKLHKHCFPIVVGHAGIMQRALDLREVSARVVPLDRLDENFSSSPFPSPALLPCLNIAGDELLAVRGGTIDSRAGEAAYQALVTAAKLVLSGAASGIVTAPLHKGALVAAGHHYPGHTELLAELCHVHDFAMMLYLPPGLVAGGAGLGVVHVTLHCSLQEALRGIQTPRIVESIRLADSGMRRLMQGNPRIGVCALNPHASDGGLFGDEEQLLIAPAVSQAAALGIHVQGPYPADTLLARARRGEFDAVVAMYHDQGHIALKMLGMHQAVNITLGLPIVRTSVAHGTAFDIAWRGQAETSGMLQAIQVACQLVQSPAP